MRADPYTRVEELRCTMDQVGQGPVATAGTTVGAWRTPWTTAEPYPRVPKLREDIFGTRHPLRSVVDPRRGPDARNVMKPSRRRNPIQTTLGLVLRGPWGLWAPRGGQINGVKPLIVSSTTKWRANVYRKCGAIGLYMCIPLTFSPRVPNWIENWDSSYCKDWNFADDEKTFCETTKTLFEETYTDFILFAGIYRELLLSLKWKRGEYPSVPKYCAHSVLSHTGMMVTSFFILVIKIAFSISL